MMATRLNLLAMLCATAASQTVTLRGSGTTNPRKVHWELQSNMEAMAGQPVKLSYRAIGSGNGIDEFLAGDNDFGCAEIPLTSDQKADATGTLLELPMVLGAMSVFHSIPDAHVGTAGLELTPCMLAKIFKGEITYWNNTQLRVLPDGSSVNLGLSTVDEQITVYHRDSSSSTTKFFTKYLTEACPAHWDLGTSSFLTTWPTAFTPVSGSGGMSSRLQDNPYGIGYIDSGHGHDNGLKEVKLQNLAGHFVDSVSVGEAGVLAAADSAAGDFPADATGSWESVNLINQDGDTTWPIVAVSYLMVRQDQTGQGSTGSLLKAYLSMVMDNTKYGGQTVLGKYNFYPITSAMRDMNTAAIGSIQVDADAPIFTLQEFDDSVDVDNGPSPTTFSPKRTSHELRLLAAHDKTLAQLSSLLKAGHDMSIPLEMHGSGTTNPSKLIWKMMATLKGMAVRPLHMSYRAIGSSTGIKEFKAGNSHFGSAEIPLSEDDKIAISGDENAPAEVLQFPLVLGAMSAFHSVPTEYLNGADGLHLTPCVLAKIFSRQITTWDHDEIVQLNPNANLPNRGIVMLHRKEGSSTTNFFTKYLHETTQEQCPSAWTLGWGAALTTSAHVAKYPFAYGTWAPDQETTPTGGGVITCEGSSGMADELADNTFAIGYIDSGHGHDKGLSEIKLQNKAGTYIDSTEAGDAGVKAAAAAAAFPDFSDGDFTEVNMLNRQPNQQQIDEFFKDGIDKTWPIVAASYLFVKRDLKSLGETAVAVKAFLEYAVGEESTEEGYSSTKGGQLYAADFNFTPLPPNLLDLNRAGIATLDLPEDVKPFQWEWETDASVGPQRNTLSCKRSSYETYAINSLAKSISKAEPTAEPAEPAAEPAAKDGGDSDEVAIVALVVAIISLLLNIALICKMCTAKNEAPFNNMNRQSDELQKGTGA